MTTVVADISVQNANVYYELGIRHAMRRHEQIRDGEDLHRLLLFFRTSTCRR